MVHVSDITITQAQYHHHLKSIAKKLHVFEADL